MRKNFVDVAASGVSLVPSLFDIMLCRVREMCRGDIQGVPLFERVKKRDVLVELSRLPLHCMRSASCI